MRGEFDFAELATQIALQIAASDCQVSLTGEKYFLYTGKHFLAQTHPATAALRNEGAEGTNQACRWVGRIHNQPHFSFPALIQMVSQVFQLTGLIDQLP